MSESVEQAALRRADVQGRAEREAAAILAEAGSHVARSGYYSYAEVATLCAIAWLQGNICGSHETLSHAERAFDRLRDSL